jgi:hypothetical protein
LFSIQKQRDEFMGAAVSGLPYEYQEFQNIGSAANVEAVGSAAVGVGHYVVHGPHQLRLQEQIPVHIHGPDRRLFPLCG